MIAAAGGPQGRDGERSGCHRCANGAGCARLASVLRAALEISRAQRDAVRRRPHNAFVRHAAAIRRYGFDFPNVADERRCWLSGKHAVVEYLANHAARLAASH